MGGYNNILDLLQNETPTPQGGEGVNATPSAENGATPKEESTPSEITTPPQESQKYDYSNNDEYLNKYYRKQNTNPDLQTKEGADNTIPKVDTTMWDRLYDELNPKPVYDKKAEERKRNLAGIKNAFSLIGNLIASKYIKPTHQDIDVDAEIQKDKDKYAELLEKYRTGKINQLMAQQKAALDERMEAIKAKNKASDSEFEMLLERYKQGEQNARAIADNEVKLAVAKSNADIANANNKRAIDVANINAQSRTDSQNKPELILPVDDGTGKMINVPLSPAQTRMLEAYMLQNVPNLDRPLGSMNTGRANNVWAASMAAKYPDLMRDFLLSQGLIQQTGNYSPTEPSTQPQYEGETTPSTPVTKKVLRDSSGMPARTYDDVMISDDEYKEADKIAKRLAGHVFEGDDFSMEYVTELNTLFGRDTEKVMKYLDETYGSR